MVDGNEARIAIGRRLTRFIAVYKGHAIASPLERPCSSNTNYTGTDNDNRSRLNHEATSP